MYRSDYVVSQTKKEILKDVFNHITYNFMIKIPESVRLSKILYRLEFDDTEYGKGSKLYDECKERLMEIGVSKIESITILDNLISKIQKQCLNDININVNIYPKFKLDLHDIEILSDDYAKRFNGGCYENLCSSKR